MGRDGKRGGEEGVSGGGRDERRDGLEETGGKGRQDRPGALACPGEVPSVDGELNGCHGHERAGGQAAIGDGDRLVLAVCGDRPCEEPAGQVAECGDQVHALIAGARIGGPGADMACGDAFVYRGEGVVDVAQQRREIPAGARRWQERTPGVTWLTQLMAYAAAPASRLALLPGDAMLAYPIPPVIPTPAAGWAGGRPNLANRPGSPNTTMRLMPVAVAVSTTMAYAR